MSIAVTKIASKVLYEIPLLLTQPLTKVHLFFKQKQGTTGGVDSIHP